MHVRAATIALPTAELHAQRHPVGELIGAGTAAHRRHSVGGDLLRPPSPLVSGLAGRSAGPTSFGAIRASCALVIATGGAHHPKARRPRPFVASYDAPSNLE